jgi:hypothetical protein
MTAGVPRLDYLGSSCPSLLLEPQRTNLVTFSEQFDNAAWSKVESSITANNGTSPDGYTNADKFIANTTSNIHFANSAIANTAAPWTYSIFAKAAGYDRLIMWTASTNFVGFNLTTGVVESTLGTGITSANIQNYGNGWYRCSITSTSTSSGTSVALAVFNAAYPNGNINPIFTGNGTDGILIYGAQFEAGAYATSYIPTLGTSVTRVADACSKTGISSLIGQTAGTLFLEIQRTGDSVANQVIFAITDGTSDNRIRVLTTSDTRLRFLCQLNGGLVEYDFTTTALTFGQTDKIAFAYKSGDIAVYINGSQVNTSTNSLTISSTLIDLVLGGVTQGTRYSQAILFPTRLSNSELASLTSL